MNTILKNINSAQHSSGAKAQENPQGSSSGTAEAVSGEKWEVSHGPGGATTAPVIFGGSARQCQAAVREQKGWQQHWEALQHLAHKYPNIQ